MMQVQLAQYVQQDRPKIEGEQDENWRKETTDVWTEVDGHY